MIVRTFEEARQCVANSLESYSPAAGGLENEEAYLVNPVKDGYAHNWILVPRNREFSEPEFLPPAESSRHALTMVKVGDWSKFPEFFPV